MPSLFGHAALAAGMAAALPDDGAARGRVALTGIVLAMLPDADVVSFAAGIPYASPFGHRGIAHSIAFAAVAAGGAALALRGRVRGDRRLAVAMYLFACAVSHGVLDAFTNGGLGVALAAPFSNTRYFFPWRPIEVSSIGIDFFTNGEGGSVLRSEAGWVLVPSLVFAAAAAGLRNKRNSVPGTVTGARGRRPDPIGTPGGPAERRR